MNKITQHRVRLEKCEEQPSDDHIVFVAGDLDATLGISVPTECHYMPLATWMGMGQPEKIVLSIVIDEGQELDAEVGER